MVEHIKRTGVCSHRNSCGFYVGDSRHQWGVGETYPDGTCFRGNTKQCPMTGDELIRGLKK